MKFASILCATIALITGLIAAWHWYRSSKVEIDPGTFKIQDGKLYLFYNKFFNNTLKSWNKDETKLQKNANANWLKFYP